jgi:hypothetical protein
MSFATKHMKESLFIIFGVIITVTVSITPPPCSQNMHTGNSPNNEITLTHKPHIPPNSPKIPLLPMF